MAIGSMPSQADTFFVLSVNLHRVLHLKACLLLWVSLIWCCPVACCIFAEAASARGWAPGEEEVPSSAHMKMYFVSYTVFLELTEK